MPNSALSAVLPSVPLPLLLLRSPRRSLHLSPSLLRSLRRFSPLRFRQFSLSLSSSTPGSSSNTGQQQYAQQPAPAPMGYTPIKTDRGVIGWLLLSIVTCGIYSYYFLYCLARDINVMCQDDGDSTPGLAAFILLSFVTCGFYAPYWYYKIGNRLQANAPRYGLMFQENGTTVLMWQIVGALLCGLGPIFAMNIIIKNTNAMATAYNVRLGARA